MGVITEDLMGLTSHGRDAIGGLWVLEEGLEVEGVVDEGGVEGALEQSGLHFDGGGWMHNRDVGEAIKRHWNTRGALLYCYERHQQKQKVREMAYVTSWLLRPGAQ